MFWVAWGKKGVRWDFIVKYFCDFKEKRFGCRVWFGVKFHRMRLEARFWNSSNIHSKYVKYYPVIGNTALFFSCKNFLGCEGKTWEKFFYLRVSSQTPTTFAVYSLVKRRRYLSKSHTKSLKWVFKILKSLQILKL
jgi:hypothetical protein